MRLYRSLLVAACLAAPFSANAVLINVTTDVNVLGVPGQTHTFGDYIFETVDPNRPLFNLTDAQSFNLDTLDFLVANACLSCAGDFRLRRLDNALFSLLSVVHAGGGVTTIGGVAVTHVGAGHLDIANFTTYTFGGELGVTNVASVVFSPSLFTQIAAFEVEIASVPEPGTLLLLSGGLLGLAFTRRRKSASA